MSKIKIVKVQLSDSAWQEISACAERELAKNGIIQNDFRFFELQATAQRDEPVALLYHFVREDAEISPDYGAASASKMEHEEGTPIPKPLALRAVEGGIIEGEPVEALGSVGGIYYKCKKVGAKKFWYQCETINGWDTCSNTGVECP
jgi:hypothetical protein